MRLLITLRPLGDYAYNMHYHHKLRGFLYNLLRETPYASLHDNTGYKFFTFSNIYPVHDLKKNCAYYFMISSPDVDLLNIWATKLSCLKRCFIGDYAFQVEKISKLAPKIENSCTLITGTPIIVRIPRRKYSEYGIKSRYPYTFWRPRYPVNGFVRQVEENLLKKYFAFYGQKVGFPLLESCIFLKSVCIHPIINGRQLKLLGSIWEFHFKALNEEKRKVLQFGLDAGFGELNSMGFGFMNI